MNEFNTNPLKTPTEIGTPKPFNSPETIIHNPELLGNDQVEAGHELGLEVDTMIKEAQNLAETTTEATVEIPQVELPAEVTPEVSTPEVQTPVMLEKKSKAPLFAGAAAGLAVLLGGLGISGMFSGKKPEMGMTDTTPKVEQANTATTENTLKVPSIETAKAPVVETPSQMSGAVMPSEPVMNSGTEEGYNDDELEISKLMNSSHMSRERAVATWANIKKVNQSDEAINMQAKVASENALKASESEKFENIAQIQELSEAEMDGMVVEDTQTGFGTKEDLSKLHGVLFSGNKIYFRFDKAALEKRVANDTNQVERIVSLAGQSTKEKSLVTIQNGNQVKTIDFTNVSATRGVINIDAPNGITIIRKFIKTADRGNSYEGSIRITK
jgi:hypothetical protein